MKMNTLSAVSRQLARSGCGRHTSKIQMLLSYQQQNMMMSTTLKYATTRVPKRDSTWNFIANRSTNKKAASYPTMKKSCHTHVFGRKHNNASNKNVAKWMSNGPQRIVDQTQQQQQQQQQRIVTNATAAANVKKKKSKRHVLSKQEEEMTHNMISANHALKLAKLKYRSENATINPMTDINNNIGTFIKNWAFNKQNKETSNPGSSFADHIRIAQNKILSLDPLDTNTTHSTSRAIVKNIENAKQNRRLPIKKVTSTSIRSHSTKGGALDAACIGKPGMRPLKKTATTNTMTSVRSHSTKGGYKGTLTRVPIPESREIRHVKKMSWSNHLEQQKTHAEDGFQPNGHVSSSPRRTVTQYQPMKLPTLKTLLKEHKDAERHHVLGDVQKPYRADDHHEIYKQKQLPLINMNVKCPMDPFIMKKIHRNALAVHAQPQKY